MSENESASEHEHESEREHGSKGEHEVPVVPEVNVKHKDKKSKMNK